MKAASLITTVVMFASWAAPVARAGELKAVTLAAWQSYLKESELGMQQRIDGRTPFLWIDESPDRAARARHGEVVIAPVVGRGTVGVANGLVHHWIGAVFIPIATVDGLLAVLRDYNKYERVYRPIVTASRTLKFTDTEQEFQMIWQRKILFVSAAIQGHYQARDVMLDYHHGYNIAEAVEVREIVDFGHSGQRLLPPDTGSGFIWRIRSVGRFAERDGGVYLEIEAIALTRDIPASLAWMVNPVVNRLSISSLTATLRQTRDAVTCPRELATTLSVPAR